MEFLSAAFFSALLAIIIIDLVLAGDNAVVIGMSARTLPKDLQKKAIVWGTLIAIVVRILATFVAVWLLEIPGLLLAGGLLLIWISYKLLIQQSKHDGAAGSGLGKVAGTMAVAEAAVGLRAAIRTIVVADAAMGLDNVLAVAGAAHGHWILVFLGLVISIPLVVWGSTLIVKLMDRFPWLIYVGGGVLAWTAGKMIADEPLLQTVFDNPVLYWMVIILVIAGVLTAGLITNQRRHQAAGS
ncbi:TerC family protein [Kyrpidia tusciae]|uniref:Integral membrane protein TerC n=1 Tax=Kyrpidia tusciae (strain DSM 2912 / NBRC 15312 / T2) TaxID=562970 RepID=D5WUT3_KYRT2|nr:TerC family protein [Kyrpidia tusciae]ADG07405.1 Integral membrane protein TerC [Kyrpidia tusciae DSM 2912]